MIKVLLFGILAEEAGKSELTFEKVNTLETLQEKLVENYPAFSKYDYQISVNKALVSNDQDLKEGDEIAFLPPFAGG